MTRALLVLIIGIISLLLGLTSSDERGWTWPLTWVGVALVVVAIVLAVRSRASRT